MTISKVYSLLVCRGVKRLSKLKDLQRNLRGVNLTPFSLLGGRGRKKWGTHSPLLYSIIMDEDFEGKFLR